MKKFAAVLLTVILLTVFVVPALAAPLGQTPTPAMDLASILKVIIETSTALASLAGVAALISVIVNIGKYFGWIPDGMSAKVFAILNLVAFIALAVTRIFKPDLSLEFLDSYAVQIATVLTYITSLVFQLGIGQVAYKIIVPLDIPAVSFSYSKTREKAARG